ncbi:MAG: hypothetical protein WBD99_10800 [Thermodesulfobacteriota bacterium]
MRRVEVENKLSAELVNLADETISAVEGTRSSGALLSQVLAKAGISQTLSPLDAGSLPSPAVIFDAFAPGGSPALRRHFAQFFDVVAEPGSRLDRLLQPGDLLFRRGEGNLGHMAMVAAPELWSYEELPSVGLSPEGNRLGMYVQVVEGGAHPHASADRFARLMLDSTGRMPYNQMLLRPISGHFDMPNNESISVEETDVPIPPPIEPHDVIDGRIDVIAQRSILRLNKGEPPVRQDAARLLAGVKTGKLAGIFGENLLAAAKLAKKLGTVRWELVPRGEDAALILDPAAPTVAPPTIIFRVKEEKPPGKKVWPMPPERMDPALQKASRTFELWQRGQLVPCASNPSATPVPNLVPATMCRVPTLGDSTVRIDMAVPSTSPGEEFENTSADVLTVSDPSERTDADDATNHIIFVQEVVVAIATGSPVPIGTPAYTWSSSDSSVASVFVPDSQAHPNGVAITGLSPGTTTITVKYKPRSGKEATAAAGLVVAAAQDEVSVIAKYPRPKAWGTFGTAAGDLAEIQTSNTSGSHWSPTSDYFRIVARTPHQHKKGITEIFEVETLGEMLGAMLTDANGNARKKHSVRRFNIFAHGNPGLIGLSGTVSATGDVTLGTSSEPSDPLKRHRIDTSVINFLNESGKALRDQAREKFLPNAEIALILCNGGVGPGMLLALDLAKTFHVTVQAYEEEIFYRFDFNTSTNRIIDRNITSVGEKGKQGKGYLCAVSVPAALAGTHLQFTKTAPKPSKKSP